MTKLPNPVREIETGKKYWFVMFEEIYVYLVGYRYEAKLDYINYYRKDNTVVNRVLRNLASYGQLFESEQDAKDWLEFLKTYGENSKQIEYKGEPLPIPVRNTDDGKKRWHIFFGITGDYRFEETYVANIYQIHTDQQTRNLNRSAMYGQVFNTEEDAKTWLDFMENYKGE